MIKKLLSFVFVFATALTVSAQIDFTADTAYLELEDGVNHKATITLTNNSGHDISLRWSLISSTLNDNNDGDSDVSNNWKIQFCECNTCYTNSFDSLPGGAQCSDPMGHQAGANSQDWYLTVDPNGQTFTDAEWVIEVTNLTDGEIDTLVYLVTLPNSINNVTYNADVTSYPNPANNELIVDYTLTNVQTPVLSVYNLIGAKVASYPLNPVNGKLSINTSNLDNGMYFYTIEEQNQRVFIQKFNVVH